MGAGKDTLAEEICHCFPRYSVRKFASKLREAISIILSIPVEKTFSDADKQRDLSNLEWTVANFVAVLQQSIKAVTGVTDNIETAELFAKKLTKADLPVDTAAIVRLVPGTTVGRLLQVVGTECFREVIGPDVWVDALMKSWELEGRPPIIIADTRFPNETVAIWRAGGVIIQVCRTVNERADGRSVNHISEHALDGEDADTVLNNDGSVADLGAGFLFSWGSLLRIAARRARSR